MPPSRREYTLPYILPKVKLLKWSLASMPFAFTLFSRRGKPERGMVSAVVSFPCFRRPLSVSSGTCRSNRSHLGVTLVTVRTTKVHETIFRANKRGLSANDRKRGGVGFGHNCTYLHIACPTFNHAWLLYALRIHLQARTRYNHQHALHKQWMAVVRYTQRREKTCSYITEYCWAR